MARGKTAIITAAIIKGGVAKSTTAAALAQAAAQDKKKVLCIDLDPQANLSFFIGADPNQPGAYQLLTGTDPAGLIQHTEQGIDTIAASPDLATLHTRTGSANRLQRALEPIKNNYDYIFIDTPPQMGELTYNALQASTGLIIPMEADSGSLQGLYQITDIVQQISESNPDLSIIGTVITRYDGRSKFDKYMWEVINQTGPGIGAPLLQTIRKGSAIKEAQGMRQSLFDYAPKSKPAAAYMKLYKIINKSK